MQCSMCGADEETLYRTLIEGVELAVCERCSRFGKKLGVIKGVHAEEAKEKGVSMPVSKPQIEKITIIVDDYSALIRKARESRGMTLKDFARMISVKESLVSKMETGSFQPSIELARKLERMLGVRLIEETEESNNASSYTARGKGEELMLGDFIKIKKRKRA